MTEEKVVVLSEAQLQKALGLKGRLGAWAAHRVMKLLEADKVNDLQSNYADYKGPAFARKVLEDVGVSYDLPREQLERIPLEGGFVTVSNHPYGSLDGLILTSVVGGRRKDFKILTTFLLSLIPSLTDYFLPVDNLSGKTGGRSISGIRMALNHIHDGHPIGFFPAGECSTWQIRRRRPSGGRWEVQDTYWADNIMRLVQKSGFPVIPIYFEGCNSLSFHLLGLVHRRLRTVRLIHEVFNKRGRVIKVRIGEPIPPEVLKGYDAAALGIFLRESCYKLGK